MKIHRSILLLFLGIIMPSLQADVLDSLRQNLSRTHTEMERVEALLALSWELKNSAPAAAWERATEALEIATQQQFLQQKALAYKHMGVIKWYDSQLDASRAYLDSARVYFRMIEDPKGEADVLNNLALNFHITGDFGSAQRKYNEALEIRKTLQDEPGMIITLINLGVMYKDLGDQEKALGMYSRALQLMEKNNDKERQADTYLNIGNIYFQEGDMTEAMENFQDALAIFEAMKDTRGIADAHVNIGDVAKRNGNLDQALEHYRTSLKLFESLEDKLGTAENLRSIGQIFENQQNWQLAQQYFQQSYDLSLQIEDEPGRATSMLRLGEAYLNQGNHAERLQSSIQWLLRSVKLSEDLKLGGELREGYHLLAEAYAGLGNYDQAYSYKLKETTILDTTYNGEKARAISRLQTFYEFKRQEQDLTLLEKEKELVQAESDQRLIQLGLVLTILSAIIILTAVLFHFYRQKQGQNRLLQEQNQTITVQNHRIEHQNLELEDKNDRLKELNEEKNYLMGVVAHDLKNPMAQIKGLVNIITMDSENLTAEQQKFLGLIDQSANRLTEMVHRILDVRAAESSTLNLNPQTLDMRDSIQQVTEQYQRVASNKGVTLQLNLPPTPQWVSVDHDATIQILDNLISNAVKFSPKEKNIYLNLHQEAGEVIFSVKDEGPGLTPDDMKKLFGRFQKLSARPTAGESSSGLGLSIVKKFAEAMNGNVWAESQPGQGATFLVRFPISKEIPILVS